MLTVVSAYGPKAPSTRVRAYDWASHLGLGIEKVEFASLPDSRPGTLLRNPIKVALAAQRVRARAARSIDRLLLSREASPFSHGSLEERLIRRASRSVYDFDDALFADREGWRRFLGKDLKCKRAASAADIVLAGNALLADWATQHAQDVRLIPSCVAPEKYTLKTAWSIAGAPRLVWLGSPSTENFVREIAGALKQVHESTGARLTLSSTARVGEWPELHQFTDRRPWSLHSFGQELAEADIAIAPLADTLFTRGKCAYKLLQYAAAGLPMIGSPVGANALALRRFDGVSVTSADDWVEGLTALINESPTVRERRGQAGRTAVDRYYSFSAWEEKWKEAVGV